MCNRESGNYISQVLHANDDDDDYDDDDDDKWNKKSLYVTISHASSRNIAASITRCLHVAITDAIRVFVRGLWLIMLPINADNEVRNEMYTLILRSRTLKYLWNFQLVIRAVRWW